MNTHAIMHRWVVCWIFKLIDDWFPPVIEELKATGKFEMMDLHVDEAEHSMEMHLPYLAKVFHGYVFCNLEFPASVLIYMANSLKVVNVGTRWKLYPSWLVLLVLKMKPCTEGCLQNMWTTQIISFLYLQTFVTGARGMWPWQMFSVLSVFTQLSISIFN